MAGLAARPGTEAAGALAGRYSVGGSLLDVGGGPLGSVLLAEIMSVRSAALYSTAPTIASAPGGAVRFPLVLLNRGNCDESFELGWGGLPDGWPAPELQDARGLPASLVDVPAFSELNLSAFVRVPGSTKADVAGLEVVAKGDAGLVSKVALTVVLEKADLAIASILPSKPWPRAGELVFVTVTVENRGRAEARGASLDFCRNGESTIIRELGTLKPGASRQESFVWVPREGKNVLVFIVDPEDAVCESNETGNTAVLTRYATAPLGAGPSGNVSAVAAAVLAGTGAAGICLAIRARRKRTGMHGQ